MFVFFGGPGFVYRAAIAWEGARFKWIAAAIVNVLFGLMGFYSNYRELLQDQIIDRKAQASPNHQ